MKISLAQINLTVGDFEQNARKIAEAYEEAEKQKSRILLTPELGVSGYPPHDLLERRELFEKSDRVVADLAKITKGKKCALIVGHPKISELNMGKGAFNAATVLEDGRAVFEQVKTLLPTYDVFDEARYFESAQKIALWNCDGVPIAIAICEDLWASQMSVHGHPLYGRNPVEEYQRLGCKLVVSLSSSPYEYGKQAIREKAHSVVAKKLGVPVIFVNQVGATDEILFDGASAAFESDGSMSMKLPSFKEVVTSVEPNKVIVENPTEVLAKGLVLGIQDYFRKSNHQMAVIGLSGGIDSAVVAALAARALGGRQVLGVAMPSQYSSSHSLADAEDLAKKLGIRFEVRPIKFIFSTLSRELSQPQGDLKPVALENLQARLRGAILMSLSNHYNALVLTTGNKSELAMGYCTLYGDMVGAIGALGDLYKIQVYELARFINQNWGNLIPENTIQKAPSAELRPNQKDEDSLPPYEILDPLLRDYIEKGMSLEELEALHSSKNKKPDWVREVIRTVELNEYKRRQAAPVLKVSSKAFGIGRRVPIAKMWGSMVRHLNK